MKKKLLIAAIFLIASTQIFAQDYKLRAEYSTNWFNANPAFALDPIGTSCSIGGGTYSTQTIQATSVNDQFVIGADLCNGVLLMRAIAGHLQPQLATIPSPPLHKIVVTMHHRLRQGACRIIHWLQQPSMDVIIPPELSITLMAISGVLLAKLPMLLSNLPIYRRLIT